MMSLMPWRRAQRHAAPARLDEWFDRVWENPFADLLPAFRGASAGMPSIDVSEDDKTVRVRAEIPGMSEKDIDVSYHDGVLTIRGEKREEKEEKGGERYYCECRYGAFSRDIPLHGGVDWQRSKASYRNGVLSITLPKTEQARKSIEIKVN